MDGANALATCDEHLHMFNCRHDQTGHPDGAPPGWYDIHRWPMKPHIVLRDTQWPRWGYERPAHRQLHALLEKERPVLEAVLGEILSQQKALKKIALEPSAPGEPHWRNGYCTALDAAALVAFVGDINC